MKETVSIEMRPSSGILTETGVRGQIDEKGRQCLRKLRWKSYREYKKGRKDNRDDEKTTSGYQRTDVVDGLLQR